MRKKGILILGFFAVILSFIYYSQSYGRGFFSDQEKEQYRETVVKMPEKTDRLVELDINDGDTYGKLMDKAEVDFFMATAIYDAAELVYDLAKIRAGRKIVLIYDKDTEELKELSYQLDSEDELHVKKKKATTTEEISAINTESNEEFLGTEESEGWVAEIIPIPYTVRIKTTEGKVETSMYQAALDNDIDIRAIIELANAFQWSIDFALDPRVGDTFKFIYEERYLDGEYVMPGQIFAGRYINNGKSYEVYYFEESEDNKGFFDTEGNSVQKLFLKAPVAFKYISSGFTTGLRYIQAFNISTGHRAIDYAAPYGTPVRSVGDGTVTFVGWDNGYGQKISIHHNATYSTNYAHLSKYAVKRGQKIKQGDVIGYVGSTGLSTGPHLHYEMVKHGTKINPLKEVLPPGEPIKEENRERYFNEIKKWQEMLENL
jgi:murein DD-endopeptidase MepM/ murein hydrolase activator NlpD